MNTAPDAWFYAIGATQNGPVDSPAIGNLLAIGALSGEHLVWREGMAEWTPIAQISQFSQYLAIAPLQYANRVIDGPIYAGFWIRFGAAILDGLIVGIPSFIAFAVLRAAAGVPVFDDETGGSTALAIQGIETITNIIVGWLYEALLTSSHRQATLGKMICGIKVTDLHGQRISFGRATGRHFAKIISTITLAIGYMMAGWTERKQALHDMIASTLVVRR